MKERILQVMVCAIGVTLAGTSSSQPARTDADWAQDVTALVIAPDGTWGAATAPLTGLAFAKAVAHCKGKYGSRIGCGYKSTFIHAGWSLALRCGQDNIIVAAKTLHAAEQAAIDSELGLRRDYRPEMLPCVRVVSIDPDGGIIAPNVGHLLRFVMDRKR